ncbi:MAG: DUF982 domain-containing protein [Rhizobiaceae bacterium]|nr:DUF982 domain-containing protein [Rhizobiaceae bacterium]
MDLGRFDKPVRIFIEERGTIAHNVASTAQAADILLHRWPGDPAVKKHLNARIACIAILEGLKEARAARLAFEAAAADVCSHKRRTEALAKTPPQTQARPVELRVRAESATIACS